MEPKLKVVPDGMVDSSDVTSQLSVAAGSLQATTAEQRPTSVDTRMSSIWGIAGASLSSTVIVKSEIVTFPASSTAVKVTVVDPTGNWLPLSESDVKLCTPQLSVDSGAIHVYVAPHWPASLDNVVSAGVLEMIGSSSSVTVTVKLASVEFPESSIAVYTMVVVPGWKASPESWLEAKLVKVQLSSADGSSQVTTAEQRPASVVVVTLTGIPEMTGISGSKTVTVKVAVVVLP